jgi:hypothetical protein
MKKRFSSLSKAEQEKIELEYHQMNPADFDDLMSQAKTHCHEVKECTLEVLPS